MNLGEREAADNVSTLTGASVFATISNVILFILSVLSSCVGPQRSASMTLPRQADGSGAGKHSAHFNESQTSRGFWRIGVDKFLADCRRTTRRTVARFGRGRLERLRGRCLRLRYGQQRRA